MSLSSLFSSHTNTLPPLRTPPELFLNTNASLVVTAEQLKREQHKAAHEAKVQRDRKSREVQKQRAQERKEKEKRRTQKQERRR